MIVVVGDLRVRVVRCTIYKSDPHEISRMFSEIDGSFVSFIFIPLQRRAIRGRREAYWEFGRSYQSSDLPRPQIRVGEQEPGLVSRLRSG